MNRAAYSDTRSSPAYHPPLPLNTSNYRSKIPNNHHEINSCAGTTFPSSIASPLTPSSTTSTTGRGAPWIRSRAATTHTSTVASYKDDFSCHTPISPLPSFPPPISTPSITNNSKNDIKNNQRADRGHHASSTRLRTQTSGAIISPLPTSTPLSPLTYTFDDIWTTKTKPTTVVIPIIDTTSAGLGKGNFHNGHQQPHHGQPVKTPTGTASHRYASILPPSRHMTQSTAVSQQQLPSPLPSPFDQNSSNNTSYVPPLPAPIPQYQRGRHIQPTTTVSSFLSFSRLSHPLQQQQQQQGFASFLEECLEESEENEPRPSENDDDGDEDHRNESTTSACDGGIIRARTTSLHYNLFPHPTTHETTTTLSDFPLPPTTTTTTTAMTGAAAAWGTTMEGKVMPWLQEAMQTVTMLESRLHELEEDCKAIPLYEQDRLEMIQVIQDLDAMVQQDQGWIEHAETAIQWTSYVLENALISSSSSNGQHTTTTTRTRERMFSGEERNSNADAGFVVPGLERNMRSEGMLPALLVRDSERILELLSSPLKTGAGTGLGSGSVSASGECLLESNVDPSQLDMSSASTVNVPRSSSAVGDDKNNSDSQKQMGEKRGLGLGLGLVVEDSSSTSRPAESQEAMYRSAIMAALRHLKTIDFAPSLASPSSSSKNGCKTTSSRESGSSVVDGQKTKEKGGRRRERTSIRTGGAPPDKALKDWLDNSSMMSIFSNDIGEDNEYEDTAEEPGSEMLSVSRVLAAVEDISTSNNNKEAHGQTARTPEMISSSPSTQMRRRRHLLVGSLCPLDEDASPSPTTYTQDNMNSSSSLVPSANSSTQTLSHALSTASINATISGSSQSLQTNLGHTLMDERVYLKQHIQQLDRLRIQELTRHQRIEQGHRQLIADLGRFSKELLGSVNELTCAQAALDEATELALLTLSTLEKGAGGGGGAVVDLTVPQKQQEPVTNEGDSIAYVASTTTTTTTTKNTNNNNHVTARHKQLIAASRKELETSGGLAGECIKRIRRLAADCVGITEFAAQGQQQQPTFSPAANVVASSFGGVSAGESSGGGSGLQRYALATELVSPLDLKAIPTTAGMFVNTTTKELGATAATTRTGMTSAQGPFQTGGSVHAKDSTLPPPPPPSSSSMFVDGIAFQEFEDHLASVRSSSSSVMNGASAISESMIIKRVFLSASSSSSSARLNTTQNNNTNNKMISKRNNNTQSSGPSAFMKKVLVEDIYPCLMPQNNGHIGATTTSALTTKQSHGWMSSFLSFSSTPATAQSSSHGINNNSAQGQWLQQLLKAMEANACEIEAWKPAPASISTTATPSTTTTTTTAAVGSKGSLVVGRTSPPKVTCCLCGTIRPCEFRLRLLDHPSSSSSSPSAPSSSSPPTATFTPHQQQQQQNHHHHALDRFCRDRIVAVCDFFMFLAHLRQGLLDQPSSLELFRRALGLRQRMALARIGSMDLVLQGRSVDASAVTRE